MSDALVKPLLRGHFHQNAFFCALGACAMLLMASGDFATFVVRLIYSLTLIGLLGVSALYHRITWSPTKRLWMKRLDHSAIFLLIAGTGTPIFYLGLPPEISNKLMWTVWSASLAGVAFSLFWIRAPKWIAAVLYLAVAWIVVPYLGYLYDGLGLTSVILIVGGGVVYSIGALVYAFRWPNPWPRIFGYHEIFHVLVVLAAVMHFVVIALLK